MGGTPSLVQSHFRIRDDTTDPFSGTPNWVTTEDQANTPTSVYSVLPGQTFRIRFTISNVGTGPLNNNQYDIRYSKNGGANAVTNSTSTNVKFDTDACPTVDSGSGSGVVGTGQLLSNGTGTYTDYTLYADNTRMNGLYGDKPDNGEFCEIEYGMSIIDADTAPGDTFDFAIYLDGAPIATYSKVPRVTVAAPSTPEAPTNLTATSLDHDSVYIAWTAPPGQITGYRIERESPIGGGWGDLVANTATSTTNYTDNSCVQNTQYNYRVSGINETGLGTASTADDANTSGFQPINSLMFGPPYF